MTTAPLTFLATLFSIMLLQTNAALAQSVAPETPPSHDIPVDTISTGPERSSGYFHVSAGFADDFDGSTMRLGAASYRYSAAQAAGSEAFGFTAELGTMVAFPRIGFDVLINGAVGTEMINNGFVLGANAGVIVAAGSGMRMLYTEMVAGYEIPLGDDIAMRLQAGPIVYFTYGPILFARGGVGIVFR